MQVNKHETIYHINETILYFGNYEYNNPIAFSNNKEELEIECKKLNKEYQKHKDILNTQILPIYKEIKRFNSDKKKEIEFHKKFPIPEKFKEYFKYREDGSPYQIRDDHEFSYEVKEIKKPYTIFDDFDSSDFT